MGNGLEATLPQRADPFSAFHQWAKNFLDSRISREYYARVRHQLITRIHPVAVNGSGRRRTEIAFRFPNCKGTAVEDQGNAIRILFLAANPIQANILRLNEEYEKIKEGI